MMTWAKGRGQPDEAPAPKLTQEEFARQFTALAAAEIDLRVGEIANNLRTQVLAYEAEAERLARRNNELIDKNRALRKENARLRRVGV